MAKSKRTRKPKQKRATSHSDFAGKKPNEGTLDKLVADGEAKNKKITDGPKPSLRQHHIKQITLAQAASDQAKGKAASARKILSNKFKAAAQDGMDVAALKRAFKNAERPMPEVVAEERNVGLYLRDMGVEIGHQWSLFDSPNIDVKAQGEHAGRNGEHADTNPHIPGSEEYVIWAEGHSIGQSAIAAGIGKSESPAEARPN